MSSNILTTYFSYSGNTREVARQIHNIVGGEIFEIQPEEEYPPKYSDVLARAKQEIRGGEMPELKFNIKNTDQYDIVFVGYPIWCNTFPAPVLTFITEHNFKGKTIIPFCTHGGGGIGRSFTELTKCCPESNVEQGISINGYNVGNTNNELKTWINKLLNNNSL